MRRAAIHLEQVRRVGHLEVETVLALELHRPHRALIVQAEHSAFKRDETMRRNVGDCTYFSDCLNSPVVVLARVLAADELAQLDEKSRLSDN